MSARAPLPAGATIGILGGGQLGRMLAMAAARLSYRTIVLAPEADCPAAQLASAQIEASYDDKDALSVLAKRCDVVTYEFENVPVETANHLARTVPVHPPARALEVAQDRLVEKRFLRDLGLRPAPFADVTDADDLAKAIAEIGTPSILKTRRFGYDGKGQLRLSDDVDPAATISEMGAGPFVLEGLVPFQAEISVIGARDADGRCVFFEPARNQHEDGILRSSTLPSGMDAGVIETAKDAARSILEALDYVGVIGVEFFVEKDGGLIVNEIAPRVHNSGHWTEAACIIDQFEMHMRAVVGLPLPDPVRHSDCVMHNLLGDDVGKVGELATDPQVRLHLYGKGEARPGRKMGHFTRLTG